MRLGQLGRFYGYRRSRVSAAETTAVMLARLFQRGVSTLRLGCRPNPPLQGCCAAAVLQLATAADACVSAAAQTPSRAYATARERDPHYAELQPSDLDAFRHILGPGGVLTDATSLQAVNKHDIT